MDINSSQSQPPTPPTGFRQLHPSWGPWGSYASDLLSEASLKLADGAIWQCLQLLNRCIGTFGVILWSWIWKYFCVFLFVFWGFFVIIEGAFSSYPVLGSQVAEPPLLSLHQTPGAKKSTKTQSQQEEAPTSCGAGWQKPVCKESDRI